MTEALAPAGSSSASLPVGSHLRPVRAGFLYSSLLHNGVRPFCLVFDVLALAAAGRVTGVSRGTSMIFIALSIVLFTSAGLYRSRLSLSALDDAPGLVGRTLAAAALTVSAGLAGLAGLAVNNDAFENRRVLVAAAAGSVLVLAGRVVSYAVVRRFRARGWVAHPTLILGAGMIGGQIASLLLEHPEYGLVPVGFLDDDPLLADAERPVPVLGSHEALASVIVEFGVHDVIVAFGSSPEHHMIDIIRTCDRLEAEIFFVPRLFELHRTSRDMEDIWGLPVVRLRRAAFRTLAWRLKRVLDVAMSGVALVVLAPLMMAITLGVRLEGGPGILFRQQRVGLDGRPFDVLKFRSLKPVNDQESATQWTIQHDERLGPVGRFLRASSLDELPQLINILRGDMTLVGPRPERPHFVETFTKNFPRYTARHRVPAGLTGWAQVHGLRGDTSIADRARFDNYYIENWSLWIDLKIILRTILSVLRRRGG